MNLLDELIRWRNILDEQLVNQWYDYTNARDTPDWAKSSLLLRLGGWVGGWRIKRVMLISAFNLVIVEVEAELGNITHIVQGVPDKA